MPHNRITSIKVTATYTTGTLQISEFFKPISNIVKASQLILYCILTPKVYTENYASQSHHYD